MPRFLQKSWTGGFSDDKFAGIKNSFFNAQGVSIRENPFSVTIANKSEKNSGSAITTLVEKIISVGNNIIAFGGNKVYIRSRTSGSWSNCYTDTVDTNDITNAIEYNDYLYWTTNTKLHRIATADIDTDWTGDVDGWAFPQTLTGNTSYKPMIEIFNKLYVWDGYNLAEWDDVAFTASKLTVAEVEVIRELTYWGGNIKIYTNEWDNYGKQYLWNAVDNSYSQFIAWDWLPFDWVINKDGRDYVFTEGRLFVSDGYNRQQLKDFNKFQWFPNGLDVLDWIIYIGWDWGLWTWGKLNKDYPEVLNFEHPYSQFSSDENPTIGAVHNSWLWLYYSRSNGTDYWIDLLSTSNVYDEGFLEWLIYTGGTISDIKDIDKLFVSYAPITLTNVNNYVDENWDTYVDEVWDTYVDNLGSGDNFIEIDLQYNQSWSYTQELAVDWTENDVIKENYWPFDEFNYIQYKITLKSYGTVTPVVNEIWFDYDFIRND